MEARLMDGVHRDRYLDSIVHEESTGDSESYDHDQICHHRKPLKIIDNPKLTTKQPNTKTPTAESDACKLIEFRNLIALRVHL
jgi:hypothetical protein